MQEISNFTQEIVKGQLSFFPILENFEEENEIELHDSVTNDIKKPLSGNSGKYLSENLDSDFWMRPFSCRQRLQSTRLLFKKKKKKRKKLLNCPLTEFWFLKLNKFPHITADSVEKLITPFSTTYLCERERGASSTAYLKNKYLSRLNLEPELCLNVSKGQPDIRKPYRVMEPHILIKKL